MSLLSCSVVGPPRGGKSSVIKRIVSHRFDNLPTRNGEFMGLPSDGKYVSMFHMPETALKASQAGPSEVLLELQDQLSQAAVLNAPLWFEVEEDGDGGGGMLDGLTGFGSSMLEGLSPRSQFLATTSVAAQRADESGALNTEHWAKRVDPRKGFAAAMASSTLEGNGGGEGGGDRAVPQMRTGMPPEAEQNPLMAHQFQSQAAESTKPKAAEVGVSPLTLPHGTHGYCIVFDLRSRPSFEQAKRTVHTLLERVGYDRTTRRPCPIALVLIGNKYDLTHGGKSSGVDHSELLELMAEWTSANSLLSQLKRQKGVQSALYRLCDKITAARKQVEATWTAASKQSTVRQQTGAKPSGDGSGNVVVMNSGNASAAEDKAMGSGEKPKVLGGLDDAQFHAMVKLRNEFDPMRGGIGGGGMSDFEVLTAVTAAVGHAQASRIEEPSAGELHEALLACPALALKYVEVSCKTNHNIHTLERVLLRSLKLLPSADKKMKQKGGGSTARGAGGWMETMNDMFVNKPAEWCGLR